MVLSRDFKQLSIDDIDLKVGDRLYKDDKLYAQVVGISESLYFLDKPN